MDAKITNDLSSKNRIPIIIVSPYATNNTTDRTHGAIYTHKSELGKLAARDAYEQAYHMIINNPFRCTALQETYFAMFAAVYLLFHSKIINIKGTNMAERDTQTKLLSIGMLARKAIMNSVDILWREVIPPDMIYSCMGTHRYKLENLLIQIIKDWILEPFYTNGTFAIEKYDANNFINKIDSSELFKHIQYKE
jgi:hypothetical protein